MAANQKRIPREWSAGRSAQSGALRTDGKRLFSYALCIGTTTADGRKIVLVTRSSVTTSRHVNGASEWANESRQVDGHRMYACGSVCDHVQAIEAEGAAS